MGPRGLLSGGSPDQVFCSFSFSWTAASSVVASAKNQGDIITGNAVGSCIFNLLAVVGITATVAPLNSKEVQPEDLWVMVGVVVVILPFMWTRKRLSRFEGLILLLGAIGYVVYLGIRTDII